MSECSIWNDKHTDVHKATVSELATWCTEGPEPSGSFRVVLKTLGAAEERDPGTGMDGSDTASDTSIPHTQDSQALQIVPHKTAVSTGLGSTAANSTKPSDLEIVFKKLSYFSSYVCDGLVALSLPLSLGTKAYERIGWQVFHHLKVLHIQFQEVEPISLKKGMKAVHDQFKGFRFEYLRFLSIGFPAAPIRDVSHGEAHTICAKLCDFAPCLETVYILQGTDPNPAKQKHTADGFEKRFRPITS